MNNRKDIILILVELVVTQCKMLFIFLIVLLMGLSSGLYLVLFLVYSAPFPRYFWSTLQLTVWMMTDGAGVMISTVSIFTICNALQCHLI